MGKTRSILNGKDTPCLFLYVAHDNLVCIADIYFIETLFVSIFQRNGVKEAEHYRMDNAQGWASKYFSLNDPFEFNGMYLDEAKISASGNDVGTCYEYWKYITDCFNKKISTHLLTRLTIGVIVALVGTCYSQYRTKKAKGFV